ncbi:uncharacterized protein SPPG_06642 [Spizellomyces punctatus DAOM BR117]|uniref:Uncharacterized protein n=1 Tax=Spizellomyces punctatus (strain DAOM BR117) TaxID=645134 RepID=A0A0L0HAP1_SPIPD|nr:uncharacterized protein SPPG_06642 [Spizellomyces punctatus DAOM BR117]KNC98242.1 hypothetical protein SPPG_06642 [Spizellomyces punctatus DAOM BR117]|eukprot:XP_016606282.1 hypothetical protein SPPG_06642 [Spizellomyces punctatus DAOM BR117]
MVNKRQSRPSGVDNRNQRPTKQRRVSSNGTSSSAKRPRSESKSQSTWGVSSSAAGSAPALKVKGKRSYLDVYEASDDEEDERRILARRGGGGGAVGRTMDDVENYEYHVDTIDEEDDEEIDEDEAFGESDEEKYASFFADKGAISTLKSHSATNIMSEGDENDDDGDEDDEDDEEEDDPEAYMDLSEMLGSDTKSATKSDVPARKQAFDTLLPSHQDEFEEDGSFDDLGDEDEEEDEGETMDGEDIVDGGASNDEEDLAERLSSFVQSLDGKKERTRRRVVSQTEGGEESEYNLAAHDTTAAGGSSSRRKIGLEDLMGSLGDEAGFATLKKQLAVLEKSTSKQMATIAAPLPKRVQDRYDRQAAYEETKKEVSKWAPLVKKNREADHLTLPTTDLSAVNNSSGALVGKFKASTSLESEVQKILEESYLLEKKQKEMEELELKKISKEELMERRAELAKMRALLFFKEQKQKKIAKIKSKAYRKLRKKDKIKEDLSLEELKRLDPQLAEQERDRLETERARERMTLKHKNTGKWAKQMLNRKDGDPETHRAVMEQLDKHEALKRRIKGFESDESDFDGSDEENYDGNSEVDEEGVRRKALASFDKIEEEMDQDETNAPKTGVFAMKFMQRALDKQKREARDSLEQARHGLRDDYVDDSGNDDSDSDQNAKEEVQEGGISIAGNAGRMSFDTKKTRPGQIDSRVDEDSAFEDGDGYSVRATQPINIGSKQNMASTVPAQSPIFQVESFEIEEVHDTVFTGTVNRTNVATSTSKSIRQTEHTLSPDAQDLPMTPASDDRALNSPPSDSESEQEQVTPVTRRSNPRNEDEDSINPWLAAADDTRAVLKSTHTVTSTKGGKTEKALEKLSQKRKHTRQAELTKAIGDVQLNLDGVRAMEVAASSFDSQIDPSESIPAALPAHASTTKARDSSKLKASTVTATAPIFEESDGDSDFEGNGQMKIIHSSSLKHMKDLSHRELMQMAFANDDLAAEFEEEKLLAIDEEKPKEEDLTLPGWGSWGGIGLQPKKRVVVKPAKPGQGVDEAKRQDVKLKHVIINEKRMKKAVKYMAPAVPHGFDNREQYERTIRAPLGKEWNAASAHGGMIKPRVQTKLGTVIAPLRFTGPKAKKKGAKGKV